MISRVRLHNGVKRAKRVAKALRSMGNGQWPSIGSHYAHLLVRTRKPCSCYMCGNPRRNLNSKRERLTRQEIRTSRDIDDYLEDKASWDRLFD